MLAEAKREAERIVKEAREQQARLVANEEITRQAERAAEEIKQARWIVKERQEMLAEAKREAERVVKEARDQQARLISEEEVYKQAERAAEEIIEDARETERSIRLGAEDYADEILSTLEVNLEKFLAAVRRGRDRLAGREEEPAEVG